MKTINSDNRLSGLFDDLNTKTFVGIDQMPQLVNNLEREIQFMRKNVKSPATQIRHTIVSEICRASGGNLAVPQYDQSAKSKQRVYYYNGTHWELLEQQVYYDLIRDCAVAIGEEDEYISNPTYMNPLYEAVAYNLARSRKQARPKDEVWINFQNGTLKVKSDGSVSFEDSNRDDFFCYTIPYEYDPQAQCPLWTRSLSEILPDENVRLLLQESIGTLLYKGDARIEKILVLYGSGANGKSVVLNAIEAMLGKSNTCNIPLDLLTNDPNARAQMEHKLCNFSAESGTKINPSILKDMVSGDPVPVKYLYKDVRNMDDYARTVASFNKLPKPEQTRGYYRRFTLVPFDQVFDGQNADKSLGKKLMSELPGILNWALEGLLRLVANDFNYTESEICDKALNEYRLSDDSIAAFLDDECEINEIFRTSGADLQGAYRSYCFENSFQVIGKKNFFARLQKEFKIHRVDPGHKPVFGVRIKNGINYEGKE